MSKRDPLVYLHDMLDAARTAVRFMHGRTRPDLDGDDMLALATTKAIEIIGEAAYRMPAPARSLYPQLPWPSIIAMRHELVHGYRTTSLDEVWNTVQHDLPPLIAELERVLPPDPPAP